MPAPSVSSRGEAVAPVDSVSGPPSRPTHKSEGGVAPPGSPDGESAWPGEGPGVSRHDPEGDVGADAKPGAEGVAPFVSTESSWNSVRPVEVSFNAGFS